MKLTKDRAHVRVNRAGRLRDHVKNMNPQPGDELLIGMEESSLQKTLYGAYKCRFKAVNNGLGSRQLVKRDDGKMVPVTLVTFL